MSISDSVDTLKTAVLQSHAERISAKGGQIERFILALPAGITSIGSGPSTHPILSYHPAYYD